MKIFTLFYYRLIILRNVRKMNKITAEKMPHSRVITFFHMMTQLIDNRIGNQRSQLSTRIAYEKCTERVA